MAIVDLGLPNESGISLIRKARKGGSRTAFLVVTALDGDEDIYEAFLARAAGYLHKESTKSELIRAVKWVHSGKKYVEPCVDGELASGMTRPALTER